MKESGDEMKKKKKWFNLCLATEDTNGRNNLKREGWHKYLRMETESRRKLQRSGDVSHGQPNPRSSLDNTFEVVSRASAATGWQPGKISS